MYSANFLIAMAILLGHEGGYVNHPDDPGGETNWGISKRSYPNVDIKNLTKEGALQIYWDDFWNKIDMDVFHLSVSIQIMDGAVNHGISRSIKILQQAVETLPDGIIGSKTKAAVVMADHNDVLLKYLGYRTKYFISLKTFASFGKGWMDRIANNLILSALYN